MICSRLKIRRIFTGIHFYNCVKYLALIFLLLGSKTEVFADLPHVYKNRIECIYSHSDKAFLHLNKDIYVSGEDVLFKAYLLNASNFKLDTSCKILYITLKNSNNQKIIGFRINLVNGTADGLFTLPDTLSTGCYFIKVFTNTMRNDDHDLNFTFGILVVNQMDAELETLVTDEPPEEDTIQLSFYPESGRLLAGIENRVIFLISGINDESVNLPVEIFDDSLHLIAVSTANESGIGEFSLSPDSRKKYTAVFNDHRFPIGGAITEGYALKAVINNLRGVDVHILTNSNIYKNQTLHLIYHIRGRNLTDKKFEIKNSSTVITLPANTLEPGILNLTLLDSSYNYICERLIYISNDSDDIHLGLQSNIYGTRQKVSLTVHIPEKYLSSDKMSLSASVSQKLSAGSTNLTQHINDYLMFYPDAGNTNPVSFTNDSERNKNIDQILITRHSLINPWSGSKESTGSLCYSLPENQDYIISGYVYNKDHQPVPGICVYLSAPDSCVNLKYCHSDANGRFFFGLNKFYDNRDLIFQVMDGNRGNIKLEIEDKFNEELVRPSFTTGIPLNIRELMMRSRIIALVNKVYKPSLFHNLPHNEPDQPLPNYSFYGMPDNIIIPADYSELINFNEIVKNILPGVFYNKAGNKYRIRTVDLGSQIINQNEAMVFLNNIPFPDPVFISKLDTRQIKKIELKKNHLLYGDLDIYGIVAITTNQKNTYALDATHTSLIYPNTVNDVRIAIPGPDYTGNTLVSENIPDFRQTLYWDPEVKLTNGQAIIEFYTSDIKGTFTVELEGITSNGIPLSGHTYFEVK
jgi:hypothetical protein